jgi:hypothetical protein
VIKPDVLLRVYYNTRINGEKVEQIKEYVYLGSVLTRDGKCDSDIERRVNAGNKVNGALHAFISSRVVSKKSQLAVHGGVLLPTLMYESESWEKRALRSMIRLKLSDRVRNEVIRDECGVKKDVVTKIEKNMLTWFGHIERMEERRLTKVVIMEGEDLGEHFLT